MMMLMSVTGHQYVQRPSAQAGASSGAAVDSPPGLHSLATVNPVGQGVETLALERPADEAGWVKMRVAYDAAAGETICGKGQFPGAQIRSPERRPRNLGLVDFLSFGRFGDVKTTSQKIPW